VAGETGADAPSTVGAHSITASFAPRARRGCSTIELEGDVIVVDDDSGAVHLLNPTAQVVWSCFDGSSTIAEIAGDLDAVFSADHATIVEGVTDLARRLGDVGLLEAVPPSVAPSVDGRGPDPQKAGGAERPPNA
jgi:hypothetical protein